MASPDLRFTMGKNPQIRLKTPVSELKGEQGDKFAIKSLYPTLEGLQEAHPIGEEGDVYAVGSELDNAIYIWDIEKNAWVSIGSVGGNVVTRLSGGWVSFTDAEGNPTTEPYFHWLEDDNGYPVNTGFAIAEEGEF